MNFTGEGFTRLCCSDCGIVYYFQTSWTDRAREQGKSWKCPNGHGQWFGEGEGDKIRRERDRLKQLVAQRDDMIKRLQGVQRRLSATKGVVTRVKNRVSHGVCPCCNRTFENLAKHMSSKHPTYTAEAVE